MSNLYTTLESTKAALDIAAATTTYDAVILEYIEGASRRCDDVARRHFYAKTDTRDVSGYPLKDRRGVLYAPVPDLLTVTSVGKDTEGDLTFDGGTLTEGTDYYLAPRNDFPKTAIYKHLGGSESVFAEQDPYLQIVGSWGYGESASPWDATAITGTVGDTTTTTLTLSADGTVETGHTILIGTEQMYVTGLGTLSATVVRGANGTTAAAHTAATISTAQYPLRLINTVRAIVVELWNFRKTTGMQSVLTGAFQEMYRKAMTDVDVGRMLGPLRRGLT